MNPVISAVHSIETRFEKCITKWACIDQWPWLKIREHEMTEMLVAGSSEAQGKLSGS
jgi:hypothetical protein